MEDVTAKDKREPLAFEQMSRWVDNVLGQSFRKFCPGEPWTPAANLYESASGYHVVIDLAGMQPDEIRLCAEDGLLTLSGSRPTPKLPEAEEYRVHLMEIDHGSFCRRIKLPGDADLDAVQASYRAGLLVVHVPRTG